MKNDEKLKPGHVWIFTPFITVKGIRRYKKDGGLFKFQVPEKRPPKEEKPKE